VWKRLPHQLQPLAAFCFCFCLTVPHFPLHTRVQNTFLNCSGVEGMAQVVESLKSQYCQKKKKKKNPTALYAPRSWDSHSFLCPLWGGLGPHREPGRVAGLEFSMPGRAGAQ
jgi:hypothetical protein